MVGRLDRRSGVVARSASVLEMRVLGVCGLVMREGWFEIFKCVMSVRSGLVVDDSQISDVEQEGEDELRKKSGKKKKAWHVRELGGGGGTI